MQGLLRHKGVYAEGDGSWSWTADAKNERQRPLWRIEGMIYDRDEKVFYVDMQGQCTLEPWKILIDTLQVPQGSRLAICIAELGAWVDPPGFERWLQSKES